MYTSAKRQNVIWYGSSNPDPMIRSSPTTTTVYVLPHFLRHSAAHFGLNFSWALRRFEARPHAPAHFPLVQSTPKIHHVHVLHARPFGAVSAVAHE